MRTEAFRPLVVTFSWCILATLSVARLPPSGLDLLEDNFTYTFEQYMIDFNRVYDIGDNEYFQRKQIFDDNMKYIVDHNRKYIMQRKEMKEESTQIASTSSGTSTVVGASNTLNRYAQRQAEFENKLSKSGNVVKPLPYPLNRYAQRQVEFENKLSKSGKVVKPLTYLLGINDFTDRFMEEIPRGYDSMKSSRVRFSTNLDTSERPSDMKNSDFLRGSESVTSKSRRLKLQQIMDLEQKLLKALGGSFEDVSKLPDGVDWRMQGVTTPVKNQGGCGSCWAFASTAVMESHVAIQTSNRVLFELSEQQLVSCAPNPQHCGGTGGCAGATSEIAFDLIRQHGMVQEWEFGYQEYRGVDVNCTLEMHSNGDRQLYRGAVALIEDFAVLPSNNYTVLMNVVAKLGPVAVSVACLPWQFYQSGVFYSPLQPGKATDLDHLVVLEGYGTDQETGEDYWLVRNSWGPLWGEGGYIRLKRVGEEDCNMDITPDDGTACTLDEDGNPVTPAPQLICGNSGILFDSVVPLGVHLV